MQYACISVIGVQEILVYNIEVVLVYIKHAVIVYESTSYNYIL